MQPSESPTVSGPGAGTKRSGAGDESRRTAETAHRWVHEYSDLLYRQALLRLGQVEDARDIVQETLVAALHSRARGEVVGSEKAWLLGIMKHKVVDLLRRRYRQPSLVAGDELEKLEQGQFEPGNGISHWRSGSAPREWTDAERRLERGEFATMLRRCLERLPERNARAFILRELDGIATERLCAELNLSPGHLFVLLHRSRLALRRCLELGGLRPGGRDI